MTGSAAVRGTDWIDALPSDRLLAELSLWSADLIHLADDLERITPHADLLHVDVADGHFAPALLFFPDLVARIRSVSKLPIHVHLMVDDAVLLDQVRQFAEAGTDLLSIHCENGDRVEEALDLIGNLGLAAGLVLQLDTAVAKAAPHLGKLRFLTLLGTAIGVKGQGLDPRACDRLREARRLVAMETRRVVVASDGGNREETVPLLRRAGAETVVLGSLAFADKDLAARMRWLRGLEWNGALS
jgi:ribulose-phosphate 3-epimerase